MASRDRWEIESDAHTLKRVAEIKADPVRLAEAKAFLREEAEMCNRALGKNPISKHNNPATVARLKTNY